MQSRHLSLFMQIIANSVKIVFLDPKNMDKGATKSYVPVTVSDTTLLGKICYMAVTLCKLCELDKIIMLESYFLTLNTWVKKPRNTVC